MNMSPLTRLDSAKIGCLYHYVGDRHVVALAAPLLAMTSNLAEPAGEKVMKSLAKMASRHVPQESTGLLMRRFLGSLLLYINHRVLESPLSTADGTSEWPSHFRGHVFFQSAFF